MGESDPLANLREIHLPSSVSAWPPGIGWWITGAVLLFVIFTLCWWFLRLQKKRKPLQKVLKQIQDLEQLYFQTRDSQKILQILSQLMREQAMIYYPGSKVAHLYGKYWLEFLDESGKTNRFTQGEGRCLAQAPYEPNPSGSIKSVIELSRNWVKQISMDSQL